MQNYTDNELEVISAALKINVRNLQKALEATTDIAMAEAYEGCRDMVLALIQKTEKYINN
jgi:hypothetical protein